MFKIKVLTEAASEPVTLDEVKDHLHLTGTDDDDYLTALITQVRKDVELFCGLSIGEQEREWVYEFDGCVPIPYGPVTSVDKVERKTGVNEFTELTDETDYEFEYELNIFGGGLCRVTYTAGVTEEDVSVIDPSLKLGILNEIAYRYENRGDDGKGFSADALGLIIKHKDFSWE